MHQDCLYIRVNYYPKKRENDIINEIHSYLRHITIAQHVGLGGGVYMFGSWLCIT